MRTLFISGQMPHPLNTGTNQRIYHLLRAVSRVSEVTFVCPTPGGARPEGLDALQYLYVSAFTFPCESFALEHDDRLARWLSWLKSKLRRLHPTEPLLMQWSRSVEGESLIKSLRPELFDLVWIERLPLLRLLPKGLKTQVIVDLDDLEHRKLAAHFGIAKREWLWPIDYLEFLKLRRVERNLGRLPYALLVCSELDRSTFVRNERVHVVPNGVDVPPRPVTVEAPPSDPIFLFVGLMSYRPNVDAARLFALRILPLIRREVPEARFFVVGRDPLPAVQELHDGKTVVVTGAVPEVTPYLREATVVVVPIRFGGGTRIKILEAMAQCRPVVATTAGAEGLDVESGRHVLLADDPRTFAKACLHALQNPSVTSRLTTEGYQLVREKYDWKKIELEVQRIVWGVSGKASAFRPESGSNQLGTGLPACR